MKKSRNTNHKRKNRSRRLGVPILLALAVASLVHSGVGQQPVVSLPGHLLENRDFSERRDFGEAAGTARYGPPVARPPDGYPAATLAPKVRIVAVTPFTERAPRSDLPYLSAASPPGHDFLRGQPTQDIAGRMVRLPPVLQSLGRAMVPALVPNGIEQVDAPQGYKIPLSTVPNSDDVELSNHDGLISLVARDTPLNDLLSIIAQSQRLNVVCAEDISAGISITLHDVTLEDALTAVLSTAGYTWVDRNGIIQVTSMKNAASLSPETQGRSTEVFPLDYVSAGDVDQVVKGLLSPAGQSFPIQSSSADLRKTKEAVVVEDLPGYLDRVREYIFQADQPPRQVQIEAHILEVDLEDDKKCGVDFTQLFSLAGSAATLSTTGFANPLAPQAFLTTIEGGDLEAVVEALQTTTDAKTLASPRVLVVNGQTARIQIGEQLGFRVITTTETSTMESVEFLDTGVVLSVTPHISRDNRVLMQVKPQVSTGAVNPDTGLPEEETTEVETNVLLANGQGILIGGLIQEIDSNVQSKVPYIGDLWLVGKLFQRQQIIKERSEIIISLVARVMPYEPCYHAHDDFKIQRSRTPLTYGPLRRYPRPWESRLPDPILNPRPRFRRPAADYQSPMFIERQYDNRGWEEVAPSLGEP